MSQIFANVLLLAAAGCSDTSSPTMPPAMAGPFSGQMPEQIPPELAPALPADPTPPIAGESGSGDAAADGPVNMPQMGLDAGTEGMDGGDASQEEIMDGYRNTRMSGIVPEGVTSIESAATFSWANVRFWEYNTMDLDGNPLDLSRRHAIMLELTMPQDATRIESYSDPAYVLDGWTPVLDPE